MINQYIIFYYSLQLNNISFFFFSFFFRLFPFSSRWLSLFSLVSPSPLFFFSLLPIQAFARSPRSHRHPLLPPPLVHLLIVSSCSGFMVRLVALWIDWWFFVDGFLYWWMGLNDFYFYEWVSCWWMGFDFDVNGFCFCFFFLLMGFVVDCS